MATRSVFYPNTEEMMGWKVTEKGFRITLSPEVPVLIREHLGHDVDAFLADHGYQRSDVKSWVLHTGGPKVLEATADALDLHNGQLDASWDCLKQSREPVVGFRAGGAGRRDEEPASRAGDAGRARGDGAGILFGAGAAAMVRSEHDPDLPTATDVFVIGGGPAGLAAAIAARQRGFRRNGGGRRQHADRQGLRRRP